MNTIYEDVLNFVGVLHDSDPESNKVVKTQIGTAIDSALGILVQNGIGHNRSVILEPNLTWGEFFYGHLEDLDEGIKRRLKNMSFAKTFVGISVIISYDPPQASVLTALKEARDENLTRARWEVEYVNKDIG
jgi:hypothetical protein